MSQNIVRSKLLFIIKLLAMRKYLDMYRSVYGYFNLCVIFVGAISKPL